jgi:chaperone modulatory protein CbpM
MFTIVEVLQRLDDRIDRITLDDYIARAWVRPVEDHEIRYFEEIDVARIRLVQQLRQDMMINDEGVDVALHLLDQLYGLREQMRRLEQAIALQPSDIQAGLSSLLSGGG